MEHQFIGNSKFIGNHQYQIYVKLLPENETEKQAIINVQTYKATDEEREIVDGYLINLILKMGHSPMPSHIIGDSVFKIIYVDV